MTSPMMKIFKDRDRREKRIAFLWTAFFGITLIAVFVMLALTAIETLPDPKAQRGDYVERLHK